MIFIISWIIAGILGAYLYLRDCYYTLDEINISDIFVSLLIFISGYILCIAIIVYLSRSVVIIKRKR